MYFHNQSYARTQENLMRSMFSRVKDESGHQAATAMFFHTMFNNTENARAYSHVYIYGVVAPDFPLKPIEAKKTIDAVRRAHAEQINVPTGGLELAVFVDEKLHNDPRFSQCPLGSVALFIGLLDNPLWGVSAKNLIDESVTGYFTDDHTYTPLNIRGLRLLGPETKYHGSTYEVDHLRKHGDPTHLLNRELSVTYALLTVRTPDSSETDTAWFVKGMSFDISDTPSRAPMLLTKPIDTPALAGFVPRRGIGAGYQAALVHMFDDMKRTMELLNFTGTLPGFTSVFAERQKNATTFRIALAQLDGADGSIAEFNRTMAGYGAQIVQEGGTGIWYLNANDGLDAFQLSNVYEKHEVTAEASLAYALSVVDRAGIPLNGIYVLLDVIGGVITPTDKYLTRKALEDRNLHYNGAVALFGQTTRDAKVEAPELDLSRILKKLTNLAGAEQSSGKESWAYKFCNHIGEPRILRSRATLHGNLTTSQRKKLLATQAKIV